MNRFKNILLVCDEGVHEVAISRALSLATVNGARVALVDVVDAAPGDLARVFAALPGARSHDFEQEVIEFRRSRLAEIGGPFRSQGIETTDRLLQGIPFVEIIKQVLREGHDLVIKSVGGAVDTRPWLFASLDLHLLRKCPCPVWLMKRSRRRQYARVLAAVDPDPLLPERDQLNRLVMDLATSLSKRDQSELHVVHAWRLEGEDTLRHSAFVQTPGRDVDRLVREERKKRKAMLDRLLADYSEPDPLWHLHLVKGEARVVVPELARRKRVELIVMGTVARTGIPGLFIGNTAEAILNQVQCSVLAVKPEGFLTPVQLDDVSAASE